MSVRRHSNSGRLRFVGNSRSRELAWSGWTADDGAEPHERRSDPETFLGFLEALVAQGAGYVEVAGDFVLTARHAAGAVDAFTQGADPALLGDWMEL